jgi:hypothetical protein
MGGGKSERKFVMARLLPYVSSGRWAFTDSQDVTREIGEGHQARRTSGERRWVGTGHKEKRSGTANDQNCPRLFRARVSFVFF